MNKQKEHVCPACAMVMREGIFTKIRLGSGNFANIQNYVCDGCGYEKKVITKVLTGARRLRAKFRQAQNESEPIATIHKSGKGRVTSREKRNGRWNQE